MIDNIIYSHDFNSFLDGLHDADRVAIIKNRLNEFAKGEYDLDPKDCEHFDNRVKVAIDDANVVVYYDLKDNDMVMIGGRIIHQRAA